MGCSSCWTSVVNEDGVASVGVANVGVDVPCPTSDDLGLGDTFMTGKLMSVLSEWTYLYRYPCLAVRLSLTTISYFSYGHGLTFSCPNTQQAS